MNRAFFEQICRKFLFGHTTRTQTFPLKMLDTKVYKTPAGSPPIVVAIISYQEVQAILAKSVCSPVLGLVNAAKRSACKLACEYIIKNFMDKLTQHDGDDLGSIRKPDSNQHDDEDDDDFNMETPGHREGVPTGEPSAIQEESSSTINEDDANLISQLIVGPTEDRKRQHNKDLTNEVEKISDDRFNKAEGSPIFTKIPKKKK